MKLINLSFDDVIPSFKNWDRLYVLLDYFPNIKINLFVSICSVINENNNDITHPQNRDWMRELKCLPKQNFEIGYHGHYHNVNDMPEFQDMDIYLALDRFTEYENIMNKFGISYVKGFRPPRWRISEDVKRALNLLDWDFLSDAPLYYEDHKDINIPRMFSNVDIYSGWSGLYVPPYTSFLPSVGDYFFLRGHLVSACNNNLTKENLYRIVHWIYDGYVNGNTSFTFMGEHALKLKEVSGV